MNIMKNTIKSILLLMVLVLNGCSTDLLNPSPKTSLGELQAFDTKDRVVGQVNGMYAFMKNGNYLGGRYQVYNDIRADNFIAKNTNLVTGYSTWNHSVITSTNEVINLWGAVYAAVNAINIFLEGLDTNWKAGTLTGKITEAEYNQFKSEGLTLRAMCYFDMLMLYAQPYNKDNGASPGLPLRLKANKTGAENDLARSKVSEVYTQILADLNAAEPIAIDKYSTDLLNTTRVHKNTIIAFKTRVYLHMGDYAKVQTEAAKIVSATSPFVASTGVPFGLTSTFAGVFATPYTTKEVRCPKVPRRKEHPVKYWYGRYLYLTRGMKAATVSDLSRCKHNSVPGGSWSVALISSATGASLKRCGFIGSAVASNAAGHGRPIPVSCCLVSTSRFAGTENRQVNRAWPQERPCPPTLTPTRQ